MQTDPFFTDGRSAILGPLVQCLNLAGDGSTYQRYEYLGDTIDREAIEKDHADADGSPLGGDTREGFQKGAISIMVTQATHKLPRPAHILHCDFGDGDEYYRVGKPGQARERNNPKKGSFAVTRIYNPIVTTTLSEDYGQMKTFTQAAGSLTGTLAAALSYVNTRSGATLAWSLAAASGYSVPGWLTINASTGALSGTAVAGTWILDLVLTDTLAGQETRKGFGRIQLVIT